MGQTSSSAAIISRPGNRWTASRRLSVGHPSAIALHNRHVGEVLYAFNAAQASLYTIFLSLAGGGDWRFASDLWHSQRSDFAQRQLLSIYVEHGDITKSIKKSIGWCISAMDELSKKRNDFVHADFIWYYDQITPGIATEPKRRERLSDLPFERYWRHLRGDLSVIANYSYDLYLSLTYPRPLTRRPRLKLAVTMSGKTQKRRNTRKKEARHRQRKASLRS